MTVQHQLLVLEGEGAPGEADLHHMVVEVGDLGPALADLASEQLRVTPAGEHRISVVVEHDAIVAPQHDDRHGRAEQQAGRGLEALRPMFDRPQRVGPVPRFDKGAALAAAVEKYWHRTVR